MRRLYQYGVVLLGLLLALNAYAADETRILQHELTLMPDISTGRLQVEDRITVAGNGSGAEPYLQRFQLSAMFNVEHAGKRLQPVARTDTLNHYELPVATREVVLQYSAKINSTPDCDWLRETCRLFNETGIYLGPDSHWYIETANALHQFELIEKGLPANWVSLSQGAATDTDKGWRTSQAQQGIYWLASDFNVYRQAGQHAESLVYLRSPDKALAQQYLDATETYLAQYSRLLGEYPYRKFATVESFWETGWGMPSFTLLGSRVMRLPFIVHSSFPHEILHNWWGSGVYVDAAQGNWSEGLTAYLADHRIKRSQGEGAQYRRDTLQKFAAFERDAKDFPLNDFRNRHNEMTQAVGYSKGLMLFHALRQRLGDELFFLGLREFYTDYKGRPARFSDLQHSFERVSKQDLNGFFTQWLGRPGAPQLALTHYEPVDNNGDKNSAAYQLQVTLAQQQAAAPFTMQVPIVATFAERGEHKQVVTLQERQQRFTLAYEQKPLSIAIDPHFDVWRIPADGEVPPTLDVLFNRDPKTFVIARKVAAGMELAWDELADTLSWGQANMQIQYDDEALPDSAIVVLLGGDNAALSQLLMRAEQAFKLSETAYTLNSVSYMCGVHSLALTVTAGEQQLILLDAATPESLQSLTRKIQHYGKYSYALFHTVSGENVAKGQWPITDSPLSINLDDKND